MYKGQRYVKFPEWEVMTTVDVFQNTHVIHTSHVSDKTAGQVKPK